MLPVLVSVFVGALAQRITGMGFALVASPALVLLLGPYDGVLVVNLCSVLSAALILPRVRRSIEWARLRVILPAAIAGCIVGAVVATVVSGPWMQLGIGALVVVALTATLLVPRLQSSEDGSGLAIGAGGVSGFMSATAGVGGPALSIYATATRWPQPTFAATAQPYFGSLALASFVAKLAASGWAVPTLEATAWLFVGLVLLAGVGVGEWLARYVSHRAARVGVIVVAYLGGLAAATDGLLELLG
nr:sulfite exporter TauE/SafE family protein [Agromyces seonyuensis]